MLPLVQLSSAEGDASAGEFSQFLRVIQHRLRGHGEHGTNRQVVQIALRRE